MSPGKKEERVGTDRVFRGIWTVAFNAISGLEWQGRRDDGSEKEFLRET